MNRKEDYSLKNIIHAGERDRDRDRERDRERDRDRDRQRETETDRDRQRDRQTEIDRDRKRDRQTETDREPFNIMLDGEAIKQLDVYVCTLDEGMVTDDGIYEVKVRCHMHSEANVW